MSKELSFEEKLTKLEEIVSELEQGNIDLDDAINKYTEAKKLAKEVLRTKEPITMDSMNSYERRLVHNALANFKGITSDSEGEEPNRRIVIKPVE